MIIAMVDNLNFELQATKHTVDYANRAKLVCFKEGCELQKGNFKAFVADNATDATTRIRKQLKEYLQNLCLNPEDFTFVFRYGDVDEFNGFWLDSLQRYSSNLSCKGLS